MNIKLNIIGSGSALPTKNNFPSSQILEIRGKQFMIDCGEGTQIRMKQMKLKAPRLGHIFISHLHGDHCFGLIGLISTFRLLNRTADLHIHAHPDLEKLLQPQLDYFCAEAPFKVIFHHIDPTVHQLVYEDRSIEVFSIPLKHRLPTCGYLFKEKEGLKHIKKDMIDFYKIPVAQIYKIKQGEDFITESGETISNDILTTPPNPSFSYAYCSDTAYNEKTIPLIRNVDILYHEATFADDEELRAGQTLHSTARQAGKIAKQAEVNQLIIGHFSARYNDKNILLKEAKEEFENTTLAEDMMTIEI